MNNNVSTPRETGDATAPTAILALDLNILHAKVPDEAHDCAAHLMACAVAINTVCCEKARLPATVSVRATRQLNADDERWFEDHPARSYRYRDPIAGEYLLNICADMPPHFVLVRQVSKGARLLAPVWLKVDATASVGRFEAKRNQQQLDNDAVLCLLFDVYCAFPGEPIDILNLLRAVGDHAWYRMVTGAARAIAPEAPAS